MAKQFPESAIKYPGVELGAGTIVEPFVILGSPPRGRQPGDLTLSIGSDGHIRSHTVIYAGTTIGDRFQTGHRAQIRESVVIGDDCSIGSGSVVEFEVRIGNGVRLHTGVFAPEYSILEDGCWLGPRVVLTNARYPGAKRTKETLHGVCIGKQARIGANATILPGRQIGAGALVGAGSVVTRDVEPDWVVAGNPARFICKASELRYSDTGEPVYDDNGE